MNIYDLLNEIVTVKKYSLSSSLFAHVKREELNTEEDKRIFDLCKNISSLSYRLTDKGIAFYPAVVWEGRRTFEIEDLTADDYILLKKINLDKIPLNLKARIADILWTQKKDYEAACIAAKAYLELFNILFSDDNWIGTLDIIKRAIFIAAQIKNNEIYEKSCKTIYDHVIRIDGNDTDFLSIGLLDILINQKYGDISALLNIIDKIIGSAISTSRKIERAYDLKIKCLKIQKDEESAKNTYLDLAQYFENRADEIVNNDIQSIINAEHFLQKAIRIYRDNGRGKEGERVHKRLIEIQKEIPKLMIPITTKVDMTKLYENIKSNMEDMSFEECVIRIVQLTTFHKQEDIKRELLDEYKKFPISHLFGSNKINSSGQIVLALPPLDLDNPEKDPELLEMHIFQKMLQSQMLIGNFALKFALSYIKETQKFQVEDLDFLVKNNPIIPYGREKIMRSAIYMFLQGQYYESMHILAPQTENLFRNIAKEVGGITVTLETDGTSKEKVLSSIFDLPELKECYDNDILFMFRGLLNEKAGANIRNEIAHGILSEAKATSGECIYFACAIIKLLAYTSSQCYNILKTSPKLKTYVETK